jgi:hypothetical protein
MDFRVLLKWVRVCLYSVPWRSLVQYCRSSVKLRNELTAFGSTRIASFFAADKAAAFAATVDIVGSALSGAIPDRALTVGPWVAMSGDFAVSGVTKLSSTLSVASRIDAGSCVSVVGSRSIVTCLRPRFSCFVGSALSVQSELTVHSSLSTSSVTRLGSPLSVEGPTHFGSVSDFSTNDSVVLGSSLSVQSYMCLRESFSSESSLFAHGRLSVLDAAV